MKMNHSKKPDFKSALDFTCIPSYSKGAVSYVMPLAICLDKIAQQQQLLQSVRTALPPHIAEHTLHCLLNDARLLIYTNSAVWASQIRFFQEDILNKLWACAQLKITRMQVKVMQSVVEKGGDRQVLLPSYKTVQAIISQVDETSVDVLDLALANLAKTLMKRIGH